MQTIPSKKLKILFALRDAEPFHYKHILLACRKRGHHVRMVYDKQWTNQDEFARLKESLVDFPDIEYCVAKQRTGFSRLFLFYVRELLSFRRYAIVKGQSLYYKDRWRGYLPKTIQYLLSLPGVEGLLGTGVAGMFLKSIERIMPPVNEICDDIRSYKPDVLFASPLDLRFSSAEVEYLKAAARMEIPSVGSILTWDNMTTKGLMHIFPDRLLAWNEVQKEEAVVFQFFPRERIRITGATLFDDWIIHLTPSTTRAEFCSMHGLQREDPIVLYLGSSANMATNESWVVSELREALDRSGDSKLARTQIIIRPHPGNNHIYDKIAGTNIAIIPKIGRLRVTEEELKLFYDTVYHSVAAIEGANTTAIIESIIAGKPAIAFITEEYKKTQMETKHFNQLVNEEALYLAHSPDEFIRILGDMINDHDEKKEKRNAFVKKYIRPLGMDRLAAEHIADEIEDVAFYQK